MGRQASRRGFVFLTCGFCVLLSLNPICRAADHIGDEKDGYPSDRSPPPSDRSRPPSDRFPPPSESPGSAPTNTTVGSGLPPETPHRPCVKTVARSSNRIACKPSTDVIRLTWDYIKMECNTTGGDGQAEKISLHYRDPWSDVSGPTTSSAPSEFERKWLGRQSAFMDRPECSVYIRYLTGKLDPRLCSWHCYRVRAGWPDEELCTADARPDCSSDVTEVDDYHLGDDSHQGDMKPSTVTSQAESIPTNGTEQETPHQQCVKTVTRSSNRIACKPSIDIFSLTWDYIKMECNTTRGDGQVEKISLHYRDPWSEVPDPTASSAPSEFERKWLGRQSAFMDRPECSVYIRYLTGKLDPRLCLWHCYRVRAGWPDEELCVADARQECSQVAMEIGGHPLAPDNRTSTATLSTPKVQTNMQPTISSEKAGSSVKPELPQRRCVKTMSRTSNRIGCEPSIDLLSSAWDYIKMVCNTTGVDAQPMTFRLYYQDPLSGVSIPTTASIPSQFERKWLGEQSAFMDRPDCSVYTAYVTGQHDPRLCLWHCYRVRAGWPDEELCVADARPDCSSLAVDRGENSLSDENRHGDGNPLLVTTWAKPVSTNSSEQENEVGRREKVWPSDWKWWPEFKVRKSRLGAESQQYRGPLSPGPFLAPKSIKKKASVMCFRSSRTITMKILPFQEPQQVDVGECSTVEVQRFNKKTFTKFPKHIEKCRRRQSCLPVVSNAVQSRTWNGPIDHLVIKQCGCLPHQRRRGRQRTRLTCQRATSTQTFFANTPYNQMVDVGVCVGRCGQRQKRGALCSPTELTRKKVTGPNGGFFVESIRACGCETRCYRMPFNISFYGRNKETSRLEKRVVDAGQCVGYCGHPSMWNAFGPQKKLSNDQKQLPTMSKCTPNPSDLVKHTWVDFTGQKRTITEIKSCYCGIMNSLQA